jgi:hypothetical protein
VTCIKDICNKYFLDQEEIIYLHNNNCLTLKSCRYMSETKKPKANILQQMLEDKKAIRQCIQEHGDVKKLAKKRGIKLATPV